MGREGLGGYSDERRPVLILTGNDVIDHLNEIVGVAATRTIRGLTTEIVLTQDDGMPARPRVRRISIMSCLQVTVEMIWASASLAVSLRLSHGCAAQTATRTVRTGGRGFRFSLAWHAPIARVFLPPVHRPRNRFARCRAGQRRNRCGLSSLASIRAGVAPKAASLERRDSCVTPGALAFLCPGDAGSSVPPKTRVD